MATIRNSITIRRGNSNTFKVTLRRGGVTIEEDLVVAAKATFVISNASTKKVVICEVWNTGDTESKVRIEGPKVLLVADSTLMNILPGLYDISVEIKWSDTYKLEWYLPKSVQVVPDRIH